MGDLTKRVFDFCLLIPCYNNFEGLVESLDTVIYPEDRYVILIIDDGSDQPLNEELLKARLKKGKPVFLLSNSGNTGITRALNKGLSWIEANTVSKYIARLDCGDTCTPDRFKMQVDYLDQHPQTALVGSWCRFVDKKTSKGYSYKTPVDDSHIRRAMYFRNLFIHPTVMFRTSALKDAGYYPEDFDYAEDYAFFWMLIRFHEGHIIDNFLVICELTNKGISYQNRSKQLVSRWKVIKAIAPSSPRKIVAYIRLLVLLFIPIELILRLRKIKG